MRRQKKNAFWIALAAPGIIWLALLFIVPFYAVLAIAMGKLNELYESPVAVWNPFAWSSENLINVWHDLFGSAAFAGPIVVRTIVYVAIASCSACSSATRPRTSWPASPAAARGCSWS